MRRPWAPRCNLGAPTFQPHLVQVPPSSLIDDHHLTFHLFMWFIVFFPHQNGWAVDRGAEESGTERRLKVRGSGFKPGAHGQLSQETPSQRILASVFPFVSYEDKHYLARLSSSVTLKVCSLEHQSHKLCRKGFHCQVSLANAEYHLSSLGILK